MASVWPALDKSYGVQGVLGMSAFAKARNPILQNNFLEILEENSADNRKFSFLPKPGQQGATLTVGGDYQGNGGGVVNLANIVSLPYSGPAEFSVRKFSPL